MDSKLNLYQMFLFKQAYDTSFSIIELNKLMMEQAIIGNLSEEESMKINELSSILDSYAGKIAELIELSNHDSEVIQNFDGVS